jgi:hypothetical protein
MQLLQQLGVIPGWEEPPPVPPIPAVEGGRETTPDENRELMTSQLGVGDEQAAESVAP